MSNLDNARKFIELPSDQKKGITGLAAAVAKAAELGLPTDEVSLRKALLSSGVDPASAQGGTGGNAGVIDW